MSSEGIYLTDPLAILNDAIYNLIASSTVDEYIQYDLYNIIPKEYHQDINSLQIFYYLINTPIPYNIKFSLMNSLIDNKENWIFYIKNCSDYAYKKMFILLHLLSEPFNSTYVGKIHYDHLSLLFKVFIRFVEECNIEINLAVTDLFQDDYVNDDSSWTIIDVITNYDNHLLFDYVGDGRSDVKVLDIKLKNLCTDFIKYLYSKYNNEYYYNKYSEAYNIKMMIDYDDMLTKLQNL
jgi:hypothetical protein